MNALVPPDATPAAARLTSLGQLLAEMGVEAELCMVGGAIMTLAFDANPPTRRVTALFRPVRSIHEAAEGLVEAEALPAGWLVQSVRDVLEEPEGTHVLRAPGVTAYEARADYMFAMKCCSLAFDREPSAIRAAVADIRYLLRVLNVHSVTEARALVSPFLNDRQLPADLDELLRGLVGEHA